MSQEPPARSFSFTPDPPPEPDRPPHVITQAEILYLYLSLDLWPGPYGSVPQVIPEGGGDPT
jgi:hypothetical protein